MFKTRLRRTDPFAAVLVVYAVTFAGFSLLVGAYNPPAGVVGLVTAALIGAIGYGVARQVRG